MRKTVMKWALCSTEGFFTHIATAMTATEDARIVARTTHDPRDVKIMLFDSHKALESTVNAVEAAMAIPAENTLAKKRSPFAEFVEVRVPCTVEVTLPEPPPEIPVV